MLLTGPGGDTWHTPRATWEVQAKRSATPGVHALMRSMGRVFGGSLVQSLLVNSNQKEQSFILGSQKEKIHKGRQEENVAHKDCWVSHIRNLDLLMTLLEMRE